jgi:hypothetical protein
VADSSPSTVYEYVKTVHVKTVDSLKRGALSGRAHPQSCTKTNTNLAHQQIKLLAEHTVLDFPVILFSVVELVLAISLQIYPANPYKSIVNTLIHNLASNMKPCHIKVAGGVK